MMRDYESRPILIYILLAMNAMHLAITLFGLPGLLITGLGIKECAKLFFTIGLNLTFIYFLWTRNIIAWYLLMFSASISMFDAILVMMFSSGQSPVLKLALAGINGFWCMYLWLNKSYFVSVKKKKKGYSDDYLYSDKFWESDDHA